MDSIEKCIIERALHEQEIKNRLRRLNNRNLQIQECKVQEVKTADASLRDTYSSRFVSDIGNANNSENDCNKTGNAQSLEKQSSTYGNESNRSRNECIERRNFRDDTNIRPSYDTEPMVEVSYNAEYNVFAVETQHTKEPEFVNDSYMMEKESNDIRDRCRSALHQQEIELEKYKVYKICQLGKEEAEFSNEYDLLLQECVLKDIMCAILRSFDNIDEQIELQCLYLEKIQECENLELELSKSKTQQTDKRFANLEQHCIELELALQHEKEKNVCEKSWVKQPFPNQETENSLKEKMIP
ncbi:hypothetical protein Tco_0992505 [Tanacetum coccineum]|uniref:Uncharacterized protein n=1 Tax=Tanacetum coccineum TaxID=301880 RepID=A0ABQ5F2A3_9ASTR